MRFSARQQRVHSAFRAGFCLLLMWPRLASAEEPVREFLDGLYQRGYLDTAQEYLNHLQVDQRLSATAHEELPFHRAMVLILQVSRSVRRDERLQQLQQADQLLSDFLKRLPEHARARQAEDLRTEVRLQLTQYRISIAEQKPVTPDQETSLVGMRQQIAELRAIFLQQQDRYQQAEDNYPAFISKDEPELRKARARVLEQLIRARLDLAQCDYWEAHTYPVEHADRVRLLSDASAGYELIHQRYRSQLGGLYARLWQGKCYEELRSEQGVRLALGIYGEILGHDGTSISLTQLKDRARLYRLICLNSPYRKDYQLVQMEAEGWLESPHARIDSEAGLGIQWELCRALEFLSQEEKWPMDTRLDFLLRARERIDRLQHVTGDQTQEFTEFRKRVETKLTAAGIGSAVEN